MPPRPPPVHSRSSDFWPLLRCCFLALAGLGLVWAQMRRPPPLTHAQFQTLREGRQVSRVVVRETTPTVDLREPARPATVWGCLPSSAAVPGSSLMPELDGQSVDYRFETPSQRPAILLTFLLFGVAALVLTIFLLWLMRRRAALENLSER